MTSEMHNIVWATLHEQANNKPTGNYVCSYGHIVSCQAWPPSALVVMLTLLKVACSPVFQG